MARGTLTAIGLVLLIGASAAAAPLPYAGLTPSAAALFADGLAQFAAEETPESGLGPAFNATSCATCHNQPTTGGSSPTVVVRFGRRGPRGFDPMSDRGGPIVQRNGIAIEGCAVAGEIVPPEATVVGHRDTPALFGAGLIDAIPDRRILRRADPGDRNRDGVFGRPNLVGSRVGRFGWKAQSATLLGFVTAAYLNELGITSPDAPDELPPQGGPARCDQIRDPEDDGSRLNAVTRFLLLLAPLARDDRAPLLAEGRRSFRRSGCPACHTTTLRTARRHPIPALRGRRVPMYSDLLLHDMGPALADGIPQGFASESEFRTPPLWGAAESAPYLHDGRAATLEEAILLHDGEGTTARLRFLALSARGRESLLAFLESL